MGKMLNWKNDVCPPTKDRALARSQSAAWVLPPPRAAVFDNFWVLQLRCGGTPCPDRVG